MKTITRFIVIGLVSFLAGTTNGSEYNGIMPAIDFNQQEIIQTKSVSADDSCCVGSHGNVNVSLDGSVDIEDLTDLVFYFFYCDFCPPFNCPNAYDVNNDGNTDVTDLTMLVGYLFKGGDAPPLCLE